jgi:hypothetical protein
MEDAGAGWSFGFFTTFAPHTFSLLRPTTMSSDTRSSAQTS